MATFEEQYRKYSTNAYSKGDKVTHSGKTWISDVENNVWEAES
jgi:hypothetical protein